MKSKVLVMVILLLFPFLVKAQIDSFQMKEVLLKEVVIQSGSLQLNRKDFIPDRNVQNSTDKILNEMGGVSMIKRGNYAWEPGIRG